MANSGRPFRCCPTTWTTSFPPRATASSYSPKRTECRRSQCGKSAGATTSSRPSTSSPNSADVNRLPHRQTAVDGHALNVKTLRSNSLNPSPYGRVRFITRVQHTSNPSPSQTSSLRVALSLICVRRILDSNTVRGMLTPQALRHARLDCSHYRYKL